MQEYFKKLNQYLFQKVIGSGAFGVVYLGLDENTKIQVAIKEICVSKFDLQNPQHKKQYEMQEQELKICKTLKHNNIVELYDSIQTDKYIYLIFEYCSNGDLEMLFKKNRFLENDIKAIFQQIINGIKYLNNKKVVHRDLKLANIYITSDCVIKIGDFGFARYSDHIMQSYCGSPITMAPEIISGQGDYNEKCDIWSLGMILYIMLFGSSYLQKHITPKTSLKDFSDIVVKSELQFPPKAVISDPLRDLLHKMLTKDPLQRISYQQLFNHPWVTDGQEESLKWTVKVIKKKLKIGEQSDVKLPMKLSLKEQFSLLFGQQEITKDKIIENIRDIMSACSENELIKQKCEKFLKRLRQMQNNYLITLMIKDTKKIIGEGNHKLFDVKHKTIYLIFKILLELHTQNKITLDKIDKIQKLNEIISDLTISNRMTITIQQINDIDTLIEDLKEVYSEYHDTKMTIVSHKKDYEIVFETKSIGEQTIMNLNSVIENQRLFRKYYIH